ncbi:MAG: high frequency lysogenization protein HflD [Gammaproteobacteria bacterium]|nr:high frequency lysogenization protein HflD [Gammaproteobacteria bacterium]
MRERTLALAGLFQSTELVRQAACHGTWSGFAATASLNSLFRLEAETAAEVYGGTDRMRLGVETLLAVLQGENRYADTLRYVVGLLQIEKKFRRSRRLQAEIGEGLVAIAQEGAELEQHEQEDLQAQHVAELYAGTISRISPRIIVSGNPQFLQNPRTIDWVRTLLLAGLRSATLWSQLGGRRFELMFGRRRIINEARSILTG